MLAAVFYGPEKLVLTSVPVPKISDDEILLKVDSCGICGSDLRIIRHGYKRVADGRIMGHEISGTVAKVGQQQEQLLKTGDRIALSADIPCGRCGWCKKGVFNQCQDRRAFGHEYDGGFAEYLKLTGRIIDLGPVVRVGETDVSQDELTICETLACCINGMEMSKVNLSDKVLIYGAGPVGCLLAMLTRSLGASSIVLADIDRKRLEVSKFAQADHYCTPDEIDALKDKITCGEGFDLVITACPSREAQESSIDHVRKRGTVCWFAGVPQDNKKVCIDSNLVHYKEARIVGSHGSTPEQHRKAVDMVLSGRINVKGLIAKSFPLEKIHDAMKMAEDKRYLKIIINP